MVAMVSLEAGGVGSLGMLFYSVLDLATFLLQITKLQALTFILGVQQSSSQNRLIIGPCLNSTMILQIWYLLATGLLPVALVAANPDCGVGFELTLDYG